MRISDWSSDVCSSDLLSPCGALVERHDPDRYLASLFAPEAQREDLFALYAFNYEVAKTAAVVSEPMIGQIRLQWWRESLAGIYAGRARQHEVVQPLARAVPARALPSALLETTINPKSVGEGKSVSVRVDLGGRRFIQKKKTHTNN